MRKPRGLRETAILMGICNLFGFAFVEPRGHAVAVQIAFMIFMIALCYVVIWYYWKGANWARILVLLTSVVSLLNLFAVPFSTPIVRFIILVEAALGIFLLVWLNKPHVRGYFRRHG